MITIQLPLSPEAFKNLVEGTAVLLAGVFFLYKAFTGYLIPNMGVALTTTRHPVPNGTNDILRIVLTLTKGPSGTGALHEAQAKVTWPGQGDPRYVQFPGIVRLSYRAVDPVPMPWSSPITKLRRWVKGSRKTITWGQTSRKNPFANLSPGESTQFTCYEVVPPSSICGVEVAILGKVVWSQYISEWRASDVSTPLAPAASLSPAPTQPLSRGTAS